jgi:hypothetical protein
MTCNRRAIRRHLVVDEEGEVWEPTAEEFKAWAGETANADPILAAVLRGFAHIWDFGAGVVVSLDPRRINPVTMTGAIDAVARLGQEWTIVSSLAPGGRTAMFMDRGSAIGRIEMLMEEVGKIEPYPRYEELLTEAAQLAETAYWDC